MPVERDYVLYSHSDEQNGQIAVGNLTTPWYDIQGHSKVVFQGSFAGGTTAVFVEQSVDGITVDHTSTDVVAGGERDAAYPYARLRVNQTTADTTNAEFSFKAAD